MMGYLFHFHPIPASKGNCPLPTVNWLRSDMLSNHCSWCSPVISLIFSESEPVAESVHLKTLKMTLYLRWAEFFRSSYLWKHIKRVFCNTTIAHMEEKQ